MSDAIQLKNDLVDFKACNRNLDTAKRKVRSYLKAKSKLFIASLIVFSVLLNPIFTRSQQTTDCNLSEEDEKKPKLTESEKCLCAQKSSGVSPTYVIGDSTFGIKFSRKLSNRTRPGVAAVRSLIERTRRTKLLGKLEIPNTDDSNSPEVAKLKKQLQMNRDERQEDIELEWKRFNEQRFPPSRKVTGRSAEIKAKATLKYKQWLGLRNTTNWNTLPQFDWRERGLDVGQVMNQGECGSCWAFAAVSVYQSAWNLEQMRLGRNFLELVVPEYEYFERQPSVQQMLNCVKESKGDCRAGWHGSAFAFMVNDHVPHIPDRLVWNKFETIAIEEYTGRKSVCKTPLRNQNVERGGISTVPLDVTKPNLLRKNSDLQATAFDRALAWGYVNEPFDEMPSIEKLKAALVEHGPLAVPMMSDHCFSVYKNGVFNGKNNRSVNHVVVLIGWDDSKKAWLIKNSWGKDWGENGFAWVEYESNNIGLFAAWIQPSPAN